MLEEYYNNPYCACVAIVFKQQFEKIVGSLLVFAAIKTVTFCFTSATTSGQSIELPLVVSHGH